MRNRILNFLKKHPRVCYRKKELATLIGIKKSEYTRYRSGLKELLNEGKIFFIRNNGYFWAGTMEKVHGKLSMNQKGFGFVMSENRDDIFVSSKKLRGAIHGDIVEVVLLPFFFGKKEEGQVTRIIKRGTSKLIGTVSRQRNGFYLENEPVTPKRGIRIIEPSRIDFSVGDALVAKVKDWGDRQRPILVEAEQVIGSVNNPGDDMKIVCHKFNLEPGFPENVLIESRKFSQNDIDREIPNRTDFRQLNCMTIDPADARDFDDAISLERDKDGNTVVGVHIADVSFFVRRGSELDREARTRGTSVYFSEGTVHMLPEFLSSNLCSLTPDQDRLVLSVLMVLDDSLNVKSCSFHAAVIQTKRKFSYSEVQLILDGKKKSRYFNLLKEMREVYLKLLQKRRELGSIDFDIPEPIFRFQNGGIPHEIHPSERLDSHRIVEEFMLLVNKEVAARVPVFQGHKFPFIYRIHDQPNEEDLNRFISILRSLNLYSIATTNPDPDKFRKILSHIEDSPYKSLIENLALRAMTKAIYSVENRGHYGLAFDNYTHFTSPIRRYPDLIVHRLLCDIVLNKSLTELSQSEEDLKKTAMESTRAEINAMEAERDYIKLKQIRWLSLHIGEKFEGIISGVISSGFFVELKHTMVEGFVRIDSLSDDYYYFDERGFSFIGKKWGEKYHMGMPVTIEVQDVVLEKRRIDFTLLE